MVIGQVGLAASGATRSVGQERRTGGRERFEQHFPQGAEAERAEPPRWLRSEAPVRKVLDCEQE